jgi:hypothetical protein
MAGELEDFARSLGCLKTLEEVAGYWQNFNFKGLWSNS